MCGRYELETYKEELIKRFLLVNELEDYREREEVFPTTVNPVVSPDRRLVPMKWGFMEAFAKRPLINARSETVLDKPTFRRPFLQARCLVPATAFFEWEKKSDDKIKRRISLPDVPVFAMAGIAKVFHTEEGNVPAYVILTTEASDQFRAVHDRMPVILDPEEEEKYLDHSLSPEDLQSLLQPTRKKLMIE